MTELLPVTQADRDRVQAFHSAMLDKLMAAVKDKAAGSRFGEDEGDAGTLVQMFAAHRLATPAPDSEKLREAEGENARLKLALAEERALNAKLSATNLKLHGAVDLTPPIAVTAGSWWYPEGDTSSDACLFSAGEVVDSFAQNLEAGETGVCIIERAVSLPDVFAAVRRSHEDEDDISFTLHAGIEEARAALGASL